MSGASSATKKTCSSQPPPKTHISLCLVHLGTATELSTNCNCGVATVFSADCDSVTGIAVLLVHADYARVKGNIQISGIGRFSQRSGALGSRPCFPQPSGIHGFRRFCERSAPVGLQTSSPKSGIWTIGSPGAGSLQRSFLGTCAACFGIGSSGPTGTPFTKDVQSKRSKILLSIGPRSPLLSFQMKPMGCQSLDDFRPEFLNLLAIERA